jgi:hypothetical protein
MHGIIFAELKAYVEGKFDQATWDALLVKAGIGPKVYLTMQAHPDSEMVALVSAASAMTGAPASAILEDFGEFLVPAYLRLYGRLVRPEWRTLDVIEHTEETIHKVVRAKNAAASPPKLRCERPSATEVVIHYTSARKMCAVAKGIVKGVAKHYGEGIHVTEASCMLEGGGACEISVKLARDSDAVHPAYPATV